jgi:hypothetical protein
VHTQANPNGEIRAQMSRDGAAVTAGLGDLRSDVGGADPSPTPPYQLHTHCQALQHTHTHTHGVQHIPIRALRDFLSSPNPHAHNLHHPPAPAVSDLSSLASITQHSPEHTQCFTYPKQSEGSRGLSLPKQSV